MKKLLILFVFGFCAFQANAQVFTGMSEIDKSKKEGVYTFVNTQEKFAASSWKAYLSKYGKVIEGKNGTFSSSDIVIPSISQNPLVIVSKVSEENKKVKLFISIATGGDEYVQTGHPKLSEASTWIEDFLKIVELEEGVRVEEKKLADLINTQAKISKQTDRLIRELDSNQRQIKNLEERLQEAKIEKEKILTNQVQNKLDLKSKEEEIAAQKLAIETAKQKIK
jgi:plasmid maintenance system antidote protein VapI